MLGIEPDAPLLGCVARLDPVKNHSLLVKAMARVVLEMPNIRLVLVGDGPLRGDIGALSRALDLEKHILILGTLADTAPVYRDLDLFVLPSLHEGTSISVLEAMSSGVPVVATSVGGTPSLLHYGARGEVIQSGDEIGLASTIVRLLSSRDERFRLAKNARAQVLTMFDHTAMTRAYEKLYRHIIKRGESPREEI